MHNELYREDRERECPKCHDTGWTPHVSELLDGTSEVALMLCACDEAYGAEALNRPEYRVIKRHDSRVGQELYFVVKSQAGQEDREVYRTWMRDDAYCTKWMFEDEAA